MHLLKWKLQPEKRYSGSGSSSWLRTITEQRQGLRSTFKQAPSLIRYAEQVLAETGIPIRQFPEQCPFRFDQVLEDE
jgi:hypothetical protein